MSEPFLGMIIIVPYNFSPRGWAFCNGQILPIAQNTALFSLLGTTYGGNGQTTFALPDLRGRWPNSSGQGPGLSNYDLGQVGGTESTTITINQMPAHAHGYTIPASSLDGTAPDPTPTSLLSNVGDGTTIYRPSGAPNVQMQGGNTAITGGSQPTSILQPYLTLNYCIALEGIFPSRN
jgi:microcystin-dependent protein